MAAHITDLLVDAEVLSLGALCLLYIQGNGWARLMGKLCHFEYKHSAV